MTRIPGTSLLIPLVFCFASIPVDIAFAQPPVWEAQTGATLPGQALDNVDDGSVNLDFGSMSFPFDGTTYTGTDILNISSNGFISLGGDNGDGCTADDCSGNPAALTGDAFPRIAPFWTDLDPGGEGGDIFISTFDDDDDPDIDRIVITFATGFNDCANNECSTLTQVQLLEDGTIIFAYNGSVQTSSQTTDILVGVSPGGGVADPGSTNLSASVPFDSGTEATVYELFTGSPPPFDLDDSNLVFSPNGNGGYDVSDTLPAPPPSSEPPIWEPALGATIRGIVAGLDRAVNATIIKSFGSMSFPYDGTLYTGTSLLSISSNGFISLGGDNGSGCFNLSCSGDPQLLLGFPFPTIAPFWTNLDPGEAGGDIYLNTFDDDADPDIDRVVITFSTGFRDCLNAECSELSQLQLLEDGTIIFGYNGIRQTDSQGSDILVGISPGNSAADPGSTSLSAITSLDTGNEPTVYELFLAPSPPPFDLDGGNVVFEPNGQGGFTVTTPGTGGIIVDSGGGGGGSGGGSFGCTVSPENDLDPLFPALMMYLAAVYVMRRRGRSWMQTGSRFFSVGTTLPR
jgi:hypothetical protein